MQILFKSRHPDAALMRESVERRVRFALRRLKALVPRADVQLADVNGPRGGLDKRCQIELRTDGAGSVGGVFGGQGLAHGPGRSAGARGPERAAHRAPRHTSAQTPQEFACA